jgi:Protein of unknown function (DUF3048) N-terminal domain/Protein of unknown function (DUF3048) C-terminal domain
MCLNMGGPCVDSRARLVMLASMYPRFSASPRPARFVAALTAIALSLTLAACGGDDEEKKPDSQPIEGGTKLAALWPLTGEPVNGKTPKHPVLVTKIDNSHSSQPQLGLEKADLITEELVEGGMTRLAVFFYRHLPKVAGPVRSMRASDIGIVKPAHGLIVASGAAGQTIGRMKRAHVPFVTEGGPGYFRAGDRSAPYNLMVSMPKLAKAKRKKSVVPASYLPWGKESDFNGARPAKSIDAVFSRSHTTQWRYQGGKYRNQNSNAAAGDRFVPDTVLVVRVRVKDAGYRDPAGNYVPETIYSGSGKMMLFHKGQVVSGTWKKGSRETPIKLSTSAGPLKVPSGHVWIELVPTDKDGGKVVYRK